MMPAPGSADYEAYNEWLHYSEGSAMLPLMLNLYVSRLKEAGAPLHPRIDSEIANHLGYVDGALKGREFFVGPSLTGADIQMSFVGEMAKVFEKLAHIRTSLPGWRRMHARPAFQRSVEKGGAYRFANESRRPGRRSVSRDPYPAAASERALWQSLSSPMGIRGYGPRLKAGRDGEGTRGLGHPRHPHHILHKYQPLYRKCLANSGRCGISQALLSTATHDRPLCP